MSKADETFDVVAKYQATSQFKDALKTIAPGIGCREKCKHAIAVALYGVETAARIDKGKLLRTAAQRKRPLKNLATTLQRAINLTAEAIDPNYILEPDIRQRWIENPLPIALERQFREIEQVIIWNNKRVRDGSQQIKNARRAAVDSAYLLLRKYSERQTIERWHTLAGVLLGEKDADLRKDLKRRRGILAQWLGPFSS
jgi:hypothetical protein